MRRLALILSAVLATACGDAGSPLAPEVPEVPLVDPDPDGDGIPTLTDQCPSQPETFNLWLDEDGCPDDTGEFYELVRADVEAYWNAAFQANSLNYVALSGFVGYQSTASSPCGEVPPENAVYCPLDLMVYYHQPFLDSFWQRVGDMAPAFIVSHEVGHHISFLLGWFKSAWSQAFPQYPHAIISDKESELMADCFGGAWTASAGERELLDSGDLDEAVVTLMEVADQDIPWFSPAGHGTAEQRVEAFVMGLTEGPGKCMSQEFFEAFPTSPATER